MDSSSLKDQELKLKVGDSSQAKDACAGKNVAVPNKITIPNFGSQFEVLKVLGSGGMGTVYKVLDIKSDTAFAVKVLKQEVAHDKVAVKRFEQEVDAASKLSHSNLVSVYKHGNTQSGTPYLVMDYYAGSNLSSILAECDSLASDEALDLFIQLGGAISHAHDKGVIHRDIKPTNVIISKSENGQAVPRIVDFGIAKVLPSSNRETLNFTETGDVFGSPEYMSPEQCMGFSLDHRSDIYSFGCLMYETLTGETPFKGQNPIQLVVKHINEEVSEFPPHKRNSKLAKDLESIVLKCLEKEPDNRFQSMNELLGDLEALKSGSPIPKYATKKRAKPTLTSAQAYSGFVLVAFALIALQGYISIYHSNIYHSASSLIMGALFVIGSYIFGSLSFSASHEFFKSKSIKDWWKQAFCLSTFVICTVMGISMLFTSVAPFLGIDYWNWPNLDAIIACFKWTQLLSAISMAVSGMGCVLFGFDKRIGWARFFASHLGLSIIIYACCLIIAPNLAARLPIAMGEISSKPVSSWLFKRASFIDGQYAKPLELLYSQAMENQNYASALDYINKLIVLDSDNAYLFSKRSKVYDAMGNTKLALSDNEQAQALRPLELSFIDERVEILLKAENPKRSLAAIDRALYNDPGNSHFLSLKASIYSRLGRYQEAIESLDEISKTKNNKNPFFHIQRAEYYRMLGKARLAYLDYRNAIATSNIWWHDTELMPVVRAYAYKQTKQLHLSRKQLGLMNKLGLERDMLKDKIYTKYSGLNPEW